MNLCIDIGNSRAKMALFNSNDTLIASANNINPSIRKVKKFHKDHGIRRAIISSTRTFDQEFVNNVTEHFPVIILDAETPVPISSRYETPSTLGKDRLAAVVGAHSIYGTQACLIVDIGTCITYDIINKGQYMGGNIAPGIHLRIAAMHRYTDKLPLVDHRINDDMIGTSTVKALQNGAFYGTKGEIESFIRQFTRQFGKLNVIFTGGDAQLFADKIESKIFVRPYLVQEGLNEILKYNAA